MAVRQRRKPRPRQQSPSARAPRRAPREPWAPRFAAAFAVLLASRLVGVALLAMDDCDEAFNFWEPVLRLAAGAGGLTTHHPT